GASPALTERGRKLSAQAGSGSRARQGATRGAEQLAIEDLGDQMIGHALQILIRGGSLRRRGLTHEERLAPRGASVLNPAYDHIQPEFWSNSGASGCKVRRSFSEGGSRTLPRIVPPVLFVRRLYAFAPDSPHIGNTHGRPVAARRHPRAGQAGSDQAQQELRFAGGAGCESPGGTRQRSDRALRRS